MPLTLFDPRVVSPQSYKDKYPELKEIPEYRELNYLQLIFVWWYANPSSPLVTFGVEDGKRVLVALDKSTLREKLNSKELDRYTNLQFPDNIREAIRRTGHLEVRLRATTKETYTEIFENYQKIKNLNNFKDNEGVVNYTEYMKISTLVANELPKLVKKIEEGMGIIDVDGVPGIDVDDADALLTAYMENKMTRS